MDTNHTLMDFSSGGVPVEFIIDDVRHLKIAIIIKHFYYFINGWHCLDQLH